MVNYGLGKIYKLINNLDETEFYVGSTTKPRLSQRLAKHKSSVKEGCTSKIYNRMREVGVENFRIILIEDYPCESKDQLRAREDHFIRELKPTLNMVRAFTTYEEKKEHDKEYYEKNRDIFKQRLKEYRENNKEQIQQRKKEYYEKNREKELQKKKEYYENNKDKIKEYREKNKEQIQQRNKEYYENNREKELQRAKVNREKKIQCPVCEKTVSKICYQRHTKSQRHQANLLKQNEVSVEIVFED